MSMAASARAVAQLYSRALPYIQLEIDRWLERGVKRAMVFSGWRQGNYSTGLTGSSTPRFQRLASMGPGGASTQNQFKVNLKGAVPLLSPLGGTISHKAKFIRPIGEGFRNGINYAGPSGRSFRKCSCVNLVR